MRMSRGVLTGGLGVVTIAAQLVLGALAVVGCVDEEVSPVTTTTSASGGAGQGGSSSSGGTTAMGGDSTTGGGGSTGTTAGGTGGMLTGGTAGAGGMATGGTGGVVAQVVPDFSLVDMNAASITAGQEVSPRDYLGRVSAWYFGHST